jgi:hypothetical protein
MKTLQEPAGSALAFAVHEERTCKMKKVCVVFALCLLLLPAVAGALDYKAWFPLLPRTLGGMAPSGEPDGMNMDMGGQKWSSVHQEYASLDGKRSAELSIIAGKAAPQAQAFQAMANMNMETEDQVMKTVDVAGHKGMLTLDKKDKSGTLMIPLKNDTVVVLHLEPASGETEIMQLGQHLPLAQIAAKAK